MSRQLISRQLRFSPWPIAVIALALALGSASTASAWGWTRRSPTYSGNRLVANPSAPQYNPRLGPVRYNQWGQPQWPYSQRTTGITQLGPVPAAAGVRSLPGWGGER